MKPFPRAERVRARIKEELAYVLARKLSDPLIALTTVTEIKMTRDLRIARVYYVISSGPEKMAAVAEAFDRAKGYIKRQLAPRLDLKYMPDLEYYYDDVFDQGQRIEKLLQMTEDSGPPENSAE